MSQSRIVKQAAAGSSAAFSTIASTFQEQPVQAALFGSNCLGRDEWVSRRLKWYSLTRADYRATLARLGINRPQYHLLWALVLPIAEFLLAERQRLSRAPVIGFVGGPGVGKTSLAYATAGCLARL